MKKTTQIALIGALAGLTAISTAAAQGMGRGMVGANCKSEIAKYCANVPHGQGAVPTCLAKYKSKLSKQCKNALARKGPGGGLGQGKGPKYRNRNN